MKKAIIATHYNPHGTPPDERLTEFFEWNWLARELGWTVYIVSDRPKTLPDHARLVLYKKPMPIFAYGSCANAGVRQALTDGAEVIIKTDIDCMLSVDLLCAAAALDAGEAICPFYMDVKPGKAVEDARPCQRSMGTLAMIAPLWLCLRGYDERMSGYGREDGELCDRVRGAGVNLLRPRGQIWHMPHGDKRARVDNRYNAEAIPVRRTENCKITKQGKWQEQPESGGWGSAA